MEPRRGSGLPPFKVPPGARRLGVREPPAS